MGVLALTRVAGPAGADADATVSLQVSGSTNVETVRQKVTELSDTLWGGTKIGEETSSNEESTVVVALPGSNLDAAVASLRRGEAGAEVTGVSIDLDPEQMQPRALATGAPASAPEPVRLVVEITEGGSGGPWGTLVVAVLFIVAALAGITLLQRKGSEAPRADGWD